MVTACPEWAKDYLLSEKVPARWTADDRAFRDAVVGTRDEALRIVPFLGIQRLWLKHKAELLEEWKRVGRRGNPPGARFERGDTPDLIKTLDGTDPRSALEKSGPPAA